MGAAHSQHHYDDEAGGEVTGKKESLGSQGSRATLLLTLIDYSVGQCGFGRDSEG